MEDQDSSLQEITCSGHKSNGIQSFGLTNAQLNEAKAGNKNGLLERQIRSGIRTSFQLKRKGRTYPLWFGQPSQAKVDDQCSTYKVLHGS